MAVSSAELLSVLRPMLADLTVDLLKRANDSRVNAAMQTVWQRERDAQRTADTFEVWARERVKQIAAAWLLSLVFVRALEDRSLIERRRIAGEGSKDSEELFFRLAPHLTHRDYLLTVFRELQYLEGARHLFGTARNPVWLLAPSGEAADRLLEAFRRTDESGRIQLDFSGSDTRFLGDLYQDLDDESRERYALLQTPEFVEEFILNETLDPAIRQYGVENVKMIDPACGSGHFLLGAYRRLLEAWRQKEPATDLRELARRALEQVNGVDLNPYAVAIARFRMTLAYLEAAGQVSLKEAPPLKLRIATADSLIRQRRFASFDHEAGGSGTFNLEDTELAAELLHEEVAYHVVVGNPPYINVKDSALRDLYRSTYVSCYRGYQLVAPFLERFFDLALNSRRATNGGYVGAIVGNGFMKREFGKKLVEEVLPKQQLTHVVDTAGAYIPGHGTPTVILFGRRWGNPERPPTTAVLTVMGKIGDSSPEVWDSISAHYKEIGYEDDYISVGELERARFAHHPWTLSGGGATDLFDNLQRSTRRTLSVVVQDIGAVALTRCDEAFVYPSSSAKTRKRGDISWRHYIAGENVRNWAISKDNIVLWPYDIGDDVDESESETLRILWPLKSLLSRRVAFGKTQLERGLKWYQFSMLFSDRLNAERKIVFPDISTHNHHCLSQDNVVFNSHAPIISLPRGATQGDHFALLGYLNSSTACFWMKQAFFNRGEGGGARVDAGMSAMGSEPWRNNYEHDAAKLSRLPVPCAVERLAPYSEALEGLSRMRDRSELTELLRDHRGTAVELRHAVTDWSARDLDRLEQMVGLQEEIDWNTYRLFKLCVDLPVLEPDRVPRMTPGLRPFELELASRSESDGYETKWFEKFGWRPHAESELSDKSAYRRLVVERRQRIRDSRDLALIENPSFKRPWVRPDHQSEIHEAARAVLLEHLEEVISTQGSRPMPVRQVAARLGADPRTNVIAELYSDDANPNLEMLFAALVSQESVPYLASLRLTDSGLEKWIAWEETWGLQRREDAGESVDLPIPPKYSKSDYRSGIMWRHRGKLDVPKERFISYPGAETEDDGSLVIGWAGWDHFQQAKALAELYNHRKREEGWPVEKLAPLLAGLLELVPWLKQWHNDPDGAFGGARVGDMYEAFVRSETAGFSLSLEDLRAWRPRSEGVGRRRRASSGEATSGRSRRLALDREDLLALVAELDDGGGAEQRALAERLGVSGNEVASVANILVAEGVLEVTSSRPKRFRHVAQDDSGALA